MELTEIIITAVLLALALVHLFYYWGVFSRFAFAKSKEISESECPPVSIVVCARDEYANLKNFLPKLLEQDYPEFEVLVVNDFSSDDSDILLEEMKKKYSHLHTFTLSQHLNFFSGKKFPLSLGIKAAKYDHLLLTDADCYPRTNQWIRHMMSEYDENTELVLGYGGYERRKGFLNILIRYETIKTAMQYFGYAKKGMPYMGTGRNLSYTKKLFFGSGGLVSHYVVASGDDDLFVNHVANAENTRMVFHEDSHTLSLPKTSFSAWFRQKSRHLTAGRLYKKSHKRWLGLYALSRTLLYLTFVAALLILHKPLMWIVPISILLVVMLSQIIVTEKVAQKLEEKNLGWLSPLLELIFVIFEPLWVLKNLLSKKNSWK